MSVAKGIGLTIITVLLVGVLFQWRDATGASGGDHFVQACDICHLAQIKVTKKNASKLVASQERLCSRCHEESIKVSHPSGIAVSRVLPAEYPLDWKGDMTCSTCHDVHGTPGGGLMHSDKRGRELCYACHDEGFFQRMRDGGESLMRSGHLVSGENLFPGIDAFSLQCVECHDSEANAPNVFIGSGGVVRHSSGSSNHPIGVSYQEAINYGGYRPRTSLPVEVLLPDGNVSCVSCHLGYKQEHGKLVRPYPGMCSLCHDL